MKQDALWRRRRTAWLLLILAGTANAAEVIDLAAPYAPGLTTTYLQLLRKVFPGAIRQGDKALEVAVDKLLRHPGSKERTHIEQGAQLTAFDARWVRGDGRRNLLLSFSAQSSEGFEPFILMVVPEGASEPQDVADLQADRTMWINDQQLSLGSDEGFIVSAAHHNSSQGYLIESMYHIRDGRLRRIAELFTLRVNGGCRNIFEESAQWSSEPVAASPYPRVLVNVTRLVGPREADREYCGSKVTPRVENYRGSWVWDATRRAYVAEREDELKKLARINEKNL